MILEQSEKLSVKFITHLKSSPIITNTGSQYFLTPTHHIVLRVRLQKVAISLVVVIYCIQ